MTPMLRLACVAAAVLLPIPAVSSALDQAELPGLADRPIHCFHQLPPVFDSRTIGKVALVVAFAHVGGAVAAGVGGGVGAAGSDLAMTKAGGKITSEYQIVDPIADVKIGLSQKLAEYLKASTRHVIDEPQLRSVNSAREYQEIVKDGGLVLEVRTTGWGIVYLPSYWNRYRVLYHVRARVFDLATGRLLASATESIKERYEDGADAPTYEDLFADNAKLLKEKLAAKVPLVTDLLFESLTTPRRQGHQRITLFNVQ